MSVQLFWEIVGLIGLNLPFGFVLLQKHLQPMEALLSALSWEGERTFFALGEVTQGLL